jgi:hypothetical protein
MAGSVAVTFNYRVERQKTKIGELTNRVSNGPDSFFGGKAVTLEGRGDGLWFLITCGRGMGRSGKVSPGNVQLNSCAIKKCKTHRNATTNLSLGGVNKAVLQ